MGAHQEIISHDSVNADYLTGALGMDLDPEALLAETNPARLMSILRTAYASVEKEMVEAKAPPVVRRNMNRLARLLGLNEIDQRLLEFTVLLHTERTLDDSADWFGSLTSVKVMRVLSGILNIPEKDVRAALSVDGILARSGLLKLDKTGMAVLRIKLNLLSTNFADHIVSADIEPVSLLRDVVFPSSPPHLQLQDYAHLRQDVES